MKKFKKIKLKIISRFKFKKWHVFVAKSLEEEEARFEIAVGDGAEEEEEEAANITDRTQSLEAVPDYKKFPLSGYEPLS